MNREKLRQALLIALERILTPLIRLWLEYGLTYDEYNKLNKLIFIKVANKHFPIPGRRQSPSRIGVVTGINRKEISALMKNMEMGSSSEYRNPREAVVSAWLSHPDFIDSDGKPRLLCKKGDGSFEELAARYGLDNPSAAILGELKRLEICIEHKDSIELISKGYIPANATPEQIEVAGLNVAAHTATITHNILNPKNQHFQEKMVEYGNLPKEPLTAIRHYGAMHSTKLLHELNEQYMVHDREINPASRGTGQYKSGFCFFYFEEEVVQEF